jgi:isocitrate dehydrogenase (NAD+)
MERPYRLGCMLGDGIGPEIVPAARRLIDEGLRGAGGLPPDWVDLPMGAAAIAEFGLAMPSSNFEALAGCDGWLMGPHDSQSYPAGWHAGTERVPSAEVRGRYELFANIRPCRNRLAVPSMVRDVDLVIVRENTEDLYAGIEFAEGEAGTLELIGDIEKLGGRRIRDDSGISIKPISIFGTERVFRFAFKWAIENGRHKVTAVHKANIMKHTDGLWLRVAEAVSKEFPQIEFEDRIVDNMAMQLVQKPELYDVMVMPNLYGDILSDLCAGLTGGLGLAPGANTGDDVAVFEATHGSAPKYAGQNKANPMAMMLSGVLMLRHIGEGEAGDRLEHAIAQVIADGRSVTYDMKPERDDPTAVGTSQVADAVIEALGTSH